jgi:hypothetical protein
MRYLDQLDVGPEGQGRRDYQRPLRVSHDGPVPWPTLVPPVLTGTDHDERASACDDAAQIMKYLKNRRRAFVRAA